MNCDVSACLDSMYCITELRIFSCVVRSGVGVGVGLVELIGVGVDVCVGVVGNGVVVVGETVGVGEAVGVGEVFWIWN
jgi:hypothetical protein